MNDARLARRIDLWGVVALGLGTAVGVSIFSAIAPAARIAGPAMLLSALLAALPMLWCLHLMRRVLGGVVGDGLGAIAFIAQALALTAFAARP